MCLGVPLRLIETKGETGTAEMGGIKMRVNLSFVENPKPGDYAIVHAGFAITIMDERSAEETMDVIRRCIDMGDEGREK